MPRSRRPKLGQHFLADERFRHRIADSLDVRPDDLVIEIGPGRGAMTTFLAERARRVVAVEIDGALATELKDQFARRSSDQPAIEIVESDILATNLFELCVRAKADRCFVFGNLPYYITSPILQHLFDSRRAIRAMALMMQREVALRLAAVPGTRDYGYLTILGQLYSKPRIIMKIPPGAFSQPPRVDSALVAFEMREKLPGWTDAELAEFTGFIKLCFAHKRKTLANNLAGIYTRRRTEEALTTLGLGFNSRAEQLAIDQLQALFRRLQTGR